ncbi:MAG: cadherin-like domain-containing protein, partial [Mariniphaga sp.]
MRTFNSIATSGNIDSPKDSLKYAVNILGWRKMLILVVFILIGISSNAATYYSRATGNWSSNTTWSLTSGGAAVGTGVFPIAGDAVTIEGGLNVTLTANAACASVTFTTATATSLTLGTYQLDVSGAITIPRSGTNNNVLAVGAGVLNAGSVAFTSSGTSTRHQITISTGTVTVSGDITIDVSGNASGLIQFTEAGTLNAGVGIMTTTNQGGTLTTFSGCTVNYNGAAQTVKSGTYIGNLTLSGSGTKTFAAATTINGGLTISGTAVASLGTFSSTSATLTLGGTTQTAGGATYGGTGSGAGNILSTYFATATGTLTVGTGCSTGTWTGTTSTDWHTASNWCNGTLPTSATNVTIPSGGNQPSITGTAACNNIIVNSGATLTVSSTGTLSVFGAITKTGTITLSTGSNVNYAGASQTVIAMSYANLQLTGSGTKTLTTSTTFGGDLTLGGTASATTVEATTIGGNLTVGTGTTFATGGTNSTNTLTANGTTSVTGTLTLANTGNKTFSNNVTINSGGVWNETGNSAINFSGNLTNNATTFTSNSGTHTFSGTSKTISGSTTTSIPSLAITGTATNSGTLTVGTALTGAGTLTNSATGTLNIGGTSTITALTSTAVGNTVNYTGGTQTVKPTTYDNLTLSGTNTKTITGLSTINGNFTTSGTISVTATTTLTIGGNVTLGTGTTFIAGSFTHNIGGDWANNGATFTSTGSTINFNKSGAQSIGGSAAIAFNNITLSGSGTKSFSKAATISGNLTINGTIANLNTFNLASATLTYGATPQSAMGDTYGSTTSSATNKSDTYFSGSGILTVGISCTPGTWLGTTSTDWNIASNWCGGVPTASTNVVIPNVTNKPTIGAAGGLCNNITINSSAILTITGSNTLIVSGNWANSGTFTGNTSTVNFNGTTQSIGAGPFYNLTLSGTGTKTLGAATTANGALAINSGVTLATANNGLTLGGNFVNSGTFTGGSSSITITGTTAQSIGVFTTTGTITISKNSGTATFTGSTSGNALTFSGTSPEIAINGTLAISGAVTLNNSTTNRAATISGSGTLTCASVAIGNNTTTGTGTFTHTLTSTIANFTVSSGLTITSKSSSSATKLANGVFNIGSGTVSVTGTVTTVNGTSNVSSLSMASGAQSGTLILGGGTPFTLSGTGTNTITLAGTTTTVKYNNGGAQTVLPAIYTNLTLAGSGSKTTASVTVNGILSMEGTATASAAPTYGSSATLQYKTTDTHTVGSEWLATTVATGGVIIANTAGSVSLNGAKVFNTSVPLTINSGSTVTPGANLLTLGGNFTNSGTLTSGSGGVTISGTMATQSIAGFTTTGTVSMTKTGGTATLTGNVNGGAFTLNGSGTLDLGTGLTNTFTGAWMRTNGTLLGNSSTLNIAGTVTNTSGTFTPGTSTVNYNGAGQTIANVPYNNLVLSGSGTKIFPSSIVIGGDVTIASGVVANLSNGTSSITNTLTFIASLQASGVWGSTASSAPAGHQINTYFTAASTGILTVSASCIAGTWIGTTTDWNLAANWCGGIPTSSTNVTIPSGGNQPVIGAAGGVCNNITINSGATLTITGSNTLTVSEDWTNNSGTFTPNTSTVIFNSTSADQTIHGTIASQTFYNLTVSKSTSKLILGKPVTINNTLTMTSGNLDVSSNTLELGISTAATGTLSYTSGTIIGGFKRWINAPGALLFPVGTATNNNKALVTFTSLTGGSLTVLFTASNPGWNNLSILTENSQIIDHQFPEGYWTLTAANSLASTNYALTLTGAGFSTYTEDNTVRIIQRTNSVSDWALPGTHDIAGYLTPTAQRTGLTVFGEFSHGALRACSLAATKASTNTTCGNNNGTITVSSPSGATNYEYRLDAGTWQTNGNFTGLASGTYSVQMRDADAIGCTLTLGNQTVSQPAVLTLSSSVVNVSCYANGNINITAGGGTGPYTYDWTDLPGTNNTEDRTGIIAGNYTVTVTDVNGCNLTSAPIAVAAATGCTGIDVCKSDAAKVFSVDPDPDVSSYTWSVTSLDGLTDYSNKIIDGLGTSSIKVNFTTFVLGAYLVKAKSVNSCGESAETLLTVYVNAPTATVSIIGGACLGTNLQLSASGGQSYSWTGPNSFTSSSASPEIYNASSPTNEGTYSVTVTDQKGCSANANVAVALSTPPTELSAITSSTCGNSAGGINITPSGGSSFTYLWNNTATTQDISSIPAGNYSVIITNNSGCSVVGNYIVSNTGGPTASVAQTNVLCNGSNTGDITLTVSGGTAPYSFAWSNGATDQNLSGLAAGTYSVIITDALDCTGAASAIITQPNALLLDKILTPINCNGASTGAINITVTGGTGIYTYAWTTADGSGLDAIGSDQTNLTAGTYLVTVTDASLCTVSGSYSITQPGAALNATTSVTNINCYGNASGMVTLAVAGGTAPFTYLWTRDEAGYGGATTKDITGLTTGTYNVTVTDAKGCSFGTTATVTQPAAALSLSITQTNINCFGGSTGTIDLTVTGGTSTYTYAWSNGATTQDLSGLIAGTYSCTVRDANGCTAASGTITITEPAAALSASISSPVNVLCNSATTGSINLTVTGGTTAYTYLWSNNATSEDLSNLVAGLYSVTVTDSKGCTAVASTTVTQPTAISVAGSVTNVLCNGVASGAINITASGGTGSFTYNWGGGITTEDRTSLAAGTYSVTVTDANNCTASSSFTVTSSPALSLTSTNNAISCKNGSDGSINLSVSGGASPYTYAWTGSNSFTASTEDISNLPAGTYAVTVTDANLCTATLTNLTLTQPSALLSVIATPTAVACLGGATGSVSAAVSGGTEPYSYAWSTGAATATVSNLIAGTYNLTVTDQNGCKTANAQAIITEPSTRIELFATTVESSSCGIGTGSINLTVVNGTAPFTYAWTNTAQTTANPVSLGANTYTATVTDQIGCSATLPVTVGTAATLSVSVTTYPKNCISTDGSAYAIVTGGVAPYTYLWNNGATTPDITNLDAGTFTISVTDANGCTVSHDGVVGSISCLPPVTVIDNFSTNYNTSMTGRTVATNDSDPDAASSPSLTMEFFNETLPSAEQGTLDWSTDYDGGFTFTPASTYAGTFSLPYKVFDPTGLSTAGTFTITVGPKAENDAFGTALNTPATDDVKTNDIYEIGSSFTKLTEPTHGTATFNPNGTFTYTPATNYAGDDSFTYQICLPSPNTGICSTATVTISVNGAADVSVTKTVDHPTPNVGDNVIFTLTATNNGPNLALGVHVDDVLPAGYTYVSNTALSLGSFVSSTGIWTIGSIANAATATLTITARVNATGSYNNTATISSTSNDPMSGNNTASVSTTPVPQSDISIVKTANNLSQSAGQPIIFTLTVTNNGPSAATGVAASDPIPSGYIYVSNSTATGNYNSGTGAWTIGNIANGATATLAITATVQASGTYANTATVSSTNADQTSGNNSSTITPVPGAISDLSITKTVNNATPYAGGIVEFTLTANNAGPSAATGVVVTDLLPAGYTYVSNTTPSAGSFVSETGKWTIGNLANGSSATLKISAKVNASGSYANSATIATTDQPDPVSSDNSAIVTPVPVAQADVSIIKTVDTTTPKMGNNVVFTLTVTNNGPSSAAGVSATDVIPSGYTYVSNTAPTAGTFVSSTGIWTIGTLANAASATLAITATVNATGDYINTATVSTTTADLTSSNNTSSKTVNPNPILIITNPAAVCTPSTVNLAATAITAGSTSGLTYTYWTNSSATIPYASPTAATAGTWYIKGTTSAGGSTVEPVVVTVSALPSAPSGTAAQSFCASAAPTVAELSATGTTIKWYAASGGGTALATSTALVDGSHYYASQTSAGGCESTARFDVTVTLNPNPTIATTTPGSRCGTGNVTLGATASAGTLNWYAASTGGTALGTGTSFDTPSISASTTYYVAAAANGCTSASRSSILATVNSFPVTSSITGNATPVCSATEITYSVVLTAGSSYIWTVPDGATIASGATGPNNNSITVNFGTINGKVSVVETNAGSCAGTAKELAISMSGCALNADFTGTPLSICQGSTVTYTNISTGTPTGYSWDFGSGATPSTANGVGPHVITYSTSGLKSVSLTISDGSSTDTETSANYITVNEASAAPTADVVQPTCATATGTITVTSGTTGLYFSINGSDYSNTNGIFTALTPGTYQLTSRNSYGCISSVNNITVNAQPSPPSAPTVAGVTQPTCSTSTGTIVFATQTGMEYSVGSGYQTSATFSGLTPGIYTLTVRRAADNTCITAAASTVTISAQPETPTAPVASATLQPTCSVATGTITVSSGTTGLSFSIDGSTYTNTTGIFTSVAAGDYYVTAKNSDGCISAQSGKITVDAQPAQASAPVTSVTQPTCSVATGTITVTVQNAGETYSFDNGVNFQSSNIKSGLIAGTYQVIIKSTGSCNSTAASATVDAQTATPATPVTSVTQPTCSVAT